MAYLCGFFTLQKNIEKIWNFFEKSVDKQEMIWYNNQAVTWDSAKEKGPWKLNNRKKQELNPCIHLSKFQK